MKNFTASIFALLLAVFPAFSQDGSLDNTFGTNGVATTQVQASSTEGLAIALQPDGKVLIGGTMQFGGTNVACARFKTDGTLDATFGSGGRVGHLYGDAALITCMAIQSDGKILLGGAANLTNGLLVRLTSTGGLDATFGSGGFQEITGGIQKVTEIRIASGGKIVGCGVAKDGTEGVFGLFRRNSNGAVDATFGTSGYALTNIGSNETITKMTLQPDGKILATGTTFLNSTKYDMVVARWSANGAPDASFGTGGKTITAFSTGDAYEQGNDIAVQADGKIVIAGRNNANSVSKFLLCRYNVNGALDATFGTNGVTITAIGTTNDEAKGIKLTADGKILVGGTSFAGTVRRFAVARYKTDGKIDTGFGTNGFTVNQILNGSAGEDITVQANGKIIVGGWASGTGGLKSFALARYQNTGVSGVQSIEPEQIKAKVFPNPVVEKTATVRFNLDQTQEVGLRLLALDGRVSQDFFSKKMTAGEQTESLNFDAGLAPGVYFLQINTQKGVATLPIQIL